MSQTIQEVAKVTIDPATIAAASQPLTRKRRRELRQERVLEYIRNKPYGERLMSRELEDAGIVHRNEGNPGINGREVLIKLVKKGLITKHLIGKLSAFYTVNEPVTTVRPADPQPDEPPVYASDIVSEHTADVDIETEAMQFAWRHPLFNNDLREFVKWYNHKQEQV